MSADFLHRAALGGHENEAANFFEIARGDQRGEFFVFLEFHQAGNGLAARGGGGFGQFVHLEPVDAALRSEQQNVAVRRSDEEMLDEILFLACARRCGPCRRATGGDRCPPDVRLM